jgi:hypothetical protein
LINPKEKKKMEADQNQIESRLDDVFARLSRELGHELRAKEEQEKHQKEKVSLISGFVVFLLVSVVFTITSGGYFLGAVLLGLLSGAVVKKIAHESHTVEKSKKIINLEESIKVILNFPKELPVEVSPFVVAALDDFLRLCELLDDDNTLKSKDLEAKDTIEIAGEILIESLRRAQLVSKILKVVKQRSEDTESKQAAERAMSGLKAIADALHDAVGAAIRYAAAPDGATYINSRTFKEKIEYLKINALSFEELASMFEDEVTP